MNLESKGSSLCKAGLPVDSQAPGKLKIDEQQADIRIDDNIAQTFEYSVAIMVWERQRLRIYDPDKVRQTAFVRAVGPSFGVGFRQEKNERLSMNARSSSLNVSWASFFGHPISAFECAELCCSWRDPSWYMEILSMQPLPMNFALNF